MQKVQKRSQPRHLLRVLRPVIAALAQLEDAAPPDIRIAIGLRDLLPVSRDVVEDESFAKRQIAERDLVRAEPSQNLVEQDRARNREIGASRLQPLHAEPFLEAERHELLAHAADLLRGNAAVAQRPACRTSVARRGDAAEAEDRARRPDDAIESGARDLIQVFDRLVLNMTDELALVARLERIAFDEALGQPYHAQLQAATELDGLAAASRNLHAATTDVHHHRDIPRHTDAVDRGGMN